jgi:DNA-binding response OmpR family regulator
MKNEGAAKHSGRLLLVDDSPADLRLLVQLLHREGFTLMVALNGKQAYERAMAQSPPDVILLDVSMPRMDGYATCQMLKADQRTAGIPVIFVTAWGTLDQRLKGFDVGAADYVLKPYNPEEVLARVRVQLQRCGSARQHDAPSIRLPHAFRQEIEPSTTEAGAACQKSMSNEQAIVATTTKYLSDHLSDAPSQKRLARLIGVNEKRLIHAFRTLLGKTVHDFLRDQRMDRARALLRDESLTVAEIADQLGFSSPANFASAFRRQLGCSPVAFRQRSYGAPSPLAERLLTGRRNEGGIFQKL